MIKRKDVSYAYAVIYRTRTKLGVSLDALSIIASRAGETGFAGLHLRELILDNCWLVGDARHLSLPVLPDIKAKQGGIRELARMAHEFIFEEDKKTLRSLTGAASRLSTAACRYSEVSKGPVAEA